MRTLLPILLLLNSGVGCMTASAQARWEYMGPGVGYQPEALFVSRNAIYLGLSEEGGTDYLGLYRYSFVEEQWGAFAWPGYGILGVSVWGESDENILILRFDEPDYRTDVLRSTDGGETWTVTFSRNYRLFGLSQAPTDSLRHVMHDYAWFTTDGGWSWNNPGGSLPWNGGYHTCFDPRDPMIAYMTGQSPFGFTAIYKSTTGGASWSWRCEPCGFWEIEVEHLNTSHVMTGRHVSTDAGATWSVASSPFLPRALVSPPWAPDSFLGLGRDALGSVFEVRRTTDLGEHWSLCGEGLPPLPPDSLYPTVMNLEAHPTQPILYAALEGSGVWRWQYTAASTPDEGAGGAPLLVYPIPSSSGFTYGVRLPAAGRALVQLFDSQGRLVRTLQDGVLSAGTQIFQWRGDRGDGVEVASGVYHLKLEAAGVQEIQKVTLVR